MKAMLLAAGRGERLRPLTDTCPKPLLKVGGKAMLQWHIERLASAGVRELVINHAWRGEQIEAAFGDGRAFGVRIIYSREGDKALDTGGGIRRALPLLGNDPFILVNGDIVTDYPFTQLPRMLNVDAHIVLVDNPPHHPDGDFCLTDSGFVQTDGAARLTYSGLGVFHPRLFDRYTDDAFPLAPVLCAAMTEDQVSGEHYRGLWLDVGTAERLKQADALAGAADPLTLRGVGCASIIPGGVPD